RVVGERREHGEKRLERLGMRGLLLAQPDGDEEVGLVAVRLAASDVADRAVAGPCPALAAVLAGGWRRCGLGGLRSLPGPPPHGRQEQYTGQPQPPDGSKAPHASPSPRGPQ